jgi:hypothetical protein
MPFANFGGYSFSPASIRKNAPESGGVYGISNSREWLLVGTSDNIQAALLSLLVEPGASLRAHIPTGFTFELCESDRLTRQQRLIFEMKPVCNHRTH